MHIFANTTRFAAESMLAGGEVAFEDMTQPQLKDELVARGEARSGLKHVLLCCSGGSMRCSCAGGHRGAAGGRRDG